MKFQATFLDGWSLAEAKVEVELTGPGLRIVDETGKERAHWDAQGLAMDAMQEGGVVHVMHASAPEATLVVRDPALEAEVLALCANRRVAALPGGKNKLVFALCALAAIVALGALLYMYTPALARWTARRVPLEHERALGTQMELILDLARCEDKAAEAALEKLAGKLGAPLATTPGEAPLSYDVRILRDEDENAFALPGGIILMTTGLLKNAQSEGEIAGVLAHEIEHVAQRHVLAGFLRDAVLSTVWAVVLGDYAGLMVVDPTTAYRIATLEFSRSDEAEADRGAVARLHRAKLRHTGLIAFFERAQKKHGSGGPDWLSTHPSHDQRIATLRATKDVPEAAASAALSESELGALRAACKDAPPDKKDRFGLLP